MSADLQTISVSVRIRPPPAASVTRPLRVLRSGEAVHENAVVKWKWDKSCICYPKELDAEKACEYQFANVFGPEVVTPEIYENVAKPIVQRTVEGYNGICMCYGQTNSGKTYSIYGEGTMPGILPLAAIDLFRLIKETPNRRSILRVSFLEIYNETLKDLLVDTHGTLTIQENPYRGAVVVGLSEVAVSSLDQVMRLLAEGEARRMMGRNNVHVHASRSHTIFQLILESQDNESTSSVRISTLNLVDLAGSESSTTTVDPTPEDVLEQIRESKTIGASANKTGGNHARPIKEREGKSIRQSLLALVRVVNMLAKQEAYVPFRDSKLTRILSTALSGNANTAIICTVNPLEVKETHYTLRFATTARSIRTRPTVVQIVPTEGLLNKYQAELQEIRSAMVQKEVETETQMASMLEKMTAEREQVEKSLTTKIAMEARERENLTKLLSEKISQEMEMRQSYESKMKEGEQLRRQYANLNRFILTSSCSSPNGKSLLGDVSVHDASFEVLSRITPIKADKANGFPVDSREGGTGMGRRRRHSFDAYRDRRSKSLFYDVQDQLDCALSRMPLPDMSNARINALQQKVRALEDQVEEYKTKEQRMLRELSKLNDTIDDYEGRARCESAMREEFYDAILPVIASSPAHDKVKEALCSLLSTVATIAPGDKDDTREILARCLELAHADRRVAFSETNTVHDIQPRANSSGTTTATNPTSSPPLGSVPVPGSLSSSNGPSASSRSMPPVPPPAAQPPAPATPAEPSPPRVEPKPTATSAHSSIPTLSMLNSATVAGLSHFTNTVETSTKGNNGGGGSGLSPRVMMMGPGSSGVSGGGGGAYGSTPAPPSSSVPKAQQPQPPVSTAPPATTTGFPASNPTTSYGGAYGQFSTMAGPTSVGLYGHHLSGGGMIPSQPLYGAPPSVLMGGYGTSAFGVGGYLPSF